MPEDRPPTFYRPSRFRLFSYFCTVYAIFTGIVTGLILRLDDPAKTVGMAVFVFATIVVVSLFVSWLVRKGD